MLRLPVICPARCCSRRGGTASAGRRFCLCFYRLRIPRLPWIFCPVSCHGYRGNPMSRHVGRVGRTVYGGSNDPERAFRTCFLDRHWNSLWSDLPVAVYYHATGEQGSRSSLQNYMSSFTLQDCFYQSSILSEWPSFRPALCSYHHFHHDLGRCLLSAGQADGLSFSRCNLFDDSFGMGHRMPAVRLDVGQDG